MSKNTMDKARLGIVAVASQDESGGQRAQELIAAAEKQMMQKGVEVICAQKVVWNPADALDVCSDLEKEGIDCLVVLHATWVLDSLTYLLVNKLQVPVVLWAVPYTETFSFACVHHMGAVLKARGLAYQYVYGLPDDGELTEKLRIAAEGGRLCRLAKDMNIALMGPRQTWRVAGPQDMSHEEWDFSETFGTTVVHLEMDAVLSKVAALSDEEGEEILKELEHRTGKAKCPKSDMLFAAKVYASMKEVMKENHLDAVAAECYPNYDGITNLTASWLADEGVVVETEGDIAHVMVKELLNCCPGDGVTMLGEVGSFDKEENTMLLSHGGSCGHYTADSVDKVEIYHSGDTGTYVGTPVKAMPVVTVSNMVGKNGSYKMLISKARTLAVTEEEWDKAGRRLALKLGFDSDVVEVLNEMLAQGLDHHLVIRPGDYTAQLEQFCDFAGVEKVLI